MTGENLATKPPQENVVRRITPTLLVMINHEIDNLRLEIPEMNLKEVEWAIKHMQQCTGDVKGSDDESEIVKLFSDTIILLEGEKERKKGGERTKKIA